MKQSNTMCSNANHVSKHSGCINIIVYCVDFSYIIVTFVTLVKSCLTCTLSSALRSTQVDDANEMKKTNQHFQLCVLLSPCT